jgi:hypothetical protein
MNICWKNYLAKNELQKSALEYKNVKNDLQEKRE